MAGIQDRVTSWSRQLETRKERLNLGHRIWIGRSEVWHQEVGKRAHWFKGPIVAGARMCWPVCVSEVRKV